MIEQFLVNDRLVLASTQENAMIYYRAFYDDPIKTCVWLGNY